jgi:LacI family transcriptional regulator
MSYRPGKNGRTRPTMTDVATEAGVSLKTVSRVVNREPGVRPETASLVNEAIERLSFRRNQNARTLRRGQRSHMLGLVIEDMSNPFYAQIFSGVEETAQDVGFLVITASSAGEPEREEELIHKLCERRVDGLLVVPAGDDYRYVLPEMRAGTRLVFVDRPPGAIEADTVLLDNFGGARSAVRHLLEMGHRRIAMIGEKEWIFTTVERLRGYREALAGAGQPFDPSLIRLGVHSTDAAATTTNDLLALGDPPTAIFAANNRITTGALRVLGRDGRRVALVGFDDFELAESLAVPATVVAFDAAELGRLAAAQLLARVAGDDGPPRRIVLPTRLIERGSGEVRP